MKWQGPDGRPKYMSCRVALLKLARRGVILLPIGKNVSFAKPAGAVTPAPFAGLSIETSLAELGRVWLVPVDSGKAELSRTWWAMMQAHHPLGAGPLCGAQLRYLIACEAGYVGGLSFSAPARRLAPRDAWIGWNDSTRQTELPKIVGNSRYLILPSVRVPNLASHALSLALSCLANDWQVRYGITPVLVETLLTTVATVAPAIEPPTGFSLGKRKGVAGKIKVIRLRGRLRTSGSIPYNRIGRRPCKRTQARPRSPIECKQALR